MGWLPFNDFFTSSRVVWNSVDCKNKSIILVEKKAFMLIDEMIEVLDLPDFKNVLHIYH